jgi:predicted NBD/HSP70 family sugar kinase
MLASRPDNRVHRARPWSAKRRTPDDVRSRAPEQGVAMSWFVVGLDNGGTKNNATVLDNAGHFLVDRMVETPSVVLDGPDAAVEALAAAFDNILAITATPRARVRGVGLDTPGPASAEGVISSRGATNFNTPPWRGFDIRGALEKRLGLPVVYQNDGNAAALYAHHVHFGPQATWRSSVSVIIGTGLGGGVVHDGRVIAGAVGMAGELGHVHVPMAGLLEADQPVPRCNCGFEGDAESVASLRGIEKNLLPYWLTRFPGHPLAHAPSLRDAAKQVRTLAQDGDAMSREIFRQQAIAVGRLFTIAANVFDPHAFFVGGGVVEAASTFREWFLDLIREHTVLRPEQAGAVIAAVPDLDMAGARGSALAAMTSAG